MFARFRERLASWRWRAAQVWAFQNHWGVGFSLFSRLRLMQAHWHHLAGSPDTWSIRVPSYPHPVYFRTGSSDLAVIQENLILEQYASVCNLPNVQYILDCGANIGTASLYLLQRYPQAKVLLVEPDPRNMAIAQRTLQPFADRVQFYLGGVWSQSGPLKLSRDGFRDSAEWSVQVRPALPEETPDVQALSIPDLLQLAGFPRADLLKVDIEAAEQVVFQDVSAWIDRVNHLIIEIHDGKCDEVVQAALKGFQRSESGELTLFQRRPTSTAT